MNHPLDDETVARLPLAAGRAELLEEIMSTPAHDRTTPTDPDRVRRAPRWAVPLAVAAAVALLVAGPLWWAGSLGGDDGDTSPAGPAAPGPDAAVSPADVYGVVLDADGWDVVYTGDGERGDIAYELGAGEITTARGASLEVNWYEADLYDGYVEDRERIVEPPAPGEPVQVLGRNGQSWAYSADDHTVITSVQDGWWFEVRVTGVDEQSFRDLLGQLQLVDEAGFEAALPPVFVRHAERLDAVQAILDGIAGVTDPVLPPGDAAPVRSVQSDPYNLGADVAGEVACRWLDAYATARAAGDDAAQAEAADTLATTRSWPVLVEMDAEGDYPEVLWSIADDAVAGRSVAGYEGAIGC